MIVVDNHRPFIGILNAVERKRMPVQIQTSAAKAEIEFVGVELIIGIQLHRPLPLTKPISLKACFCLDRPPADLR